MSTKQKSQAKTNKKPTKQYQITFVSVFFTGLVALPVPTVFLEDVVVRDADNCLLVVSLSCFSASGFLVVVLVRGTLALSGAVVGRGFAVGDDDTVVFAVAVAVAEVAGFAAYVWKCIQ